MRDYQNVPLAGCLVIMYTEVIIRSVKYAYEQKTTYRYCANCFIGRVVYLGTELDGKALANCASSCRDKYG